MAAIKVVQIAVTASTDDTWDEQYLDDKGRVWERSYNKAVGRWEWSQIDLPEEPKATT